MAAADVRDWRILRTSDDVTDEILTAVEETVDWFEDEGSIPTVDFLDRLCKSHGGSGYDPGDWDLDSYDSPAARKILSHARRVMRESRS